MRKKDSSFTQIASGLLTLGWGVDSVGILFVTPIQSLVNVLLFRVAIAVVIYVGVMKLGKLVEVKLK